MLNFNSLILDLLINNFNSFDMLIGRSVQAHIVLLLVMFIP
jgi:hypothetical protein